MCGTFGCKWEQCKRLARNGDIRLQSYSSLEDVEKSLELAASLGKTGEMETVAPQSLSPG